MQNNYYYDNIPLEHVALIQAMWMSGVLCGGAGGNGPVDGHDGAFSGRVILGDAMKRSYEVGLKWWAPSRKAHIAERQRMTTMADMNGITVTNDFAGLANRSILQFGRDRTLLAVATDTGSGVDALDAAFDHDARFGWIDKPGITTAEQYRRMCGILDGKADRRLYMLQNHRNCSANHELKGRAHKAKAAGKKVRGRFGFKQPWFTVDHESQQAESRARDENCTLLDLKWHVRDLMAWMLGEEPITLTGATEEHYFAGKVDKFKDAVTAGSSDYEFADDKLSATVECNQACEGAYWDDIYAVLYIEGEKPLMWKMAWGGGDVLWEAKVDDPNINDINDWQPIEMGPGNFDDAVFARFSRTPLGHMPSAWSEMVFGSLLEVVGTVARERELPIATEGLLPLHMQTDAPDFRTTALYGMRDVLAHRESASSSGKSVVLANMLTA